MIKSEKKAFINANALFLGDNTPSSTVIRRMSDEKELDKLVELIQQNPKYVEAQASKVSNEENLPSLENKTNVQDSATVIVETIKKDGTKELVPCIMATFVRRKAENGRFIYIFDIGQNGKHRNFSSGLGVLYKNKTLVEGQQYPFKTEKMSTNYSDGIVWYSNISLLESNYEEIGAKREERELKQAIIAETMEELDMDANARKAFLEKQQASQVSEAEKILAEKLAKLGL